MNRLDIFEYAEQHKSCPEHVNEYEVNGRKYVVHSHFVGKKDIDKVLSDIAVNQALSDVLYHRNITEDDSSKDVSSGKNIA